LASHYLYESSIYMRAGGSKPAYLEFNKRAVGKEQLAISNWQLAIGH
jgi:hypothetical protein